MNQRKPDAGRPRKRKPGTRSPGTGKQFASPGNGRAKPQTESQPSCAVILAYKDGEKHVAEQVESIYRQTHRNFSLLVCDDASELPYSQFARKSGLPGHRTSTVLRERNLGHTSNFYRGLEEAGRLHDYYAYSDQDDVWREDKLERAVRRLEPHADVPALFASNLDAIDETGAPIIAGVTQPVRFPNLRIPSFANLIVESVFNGNTMVMNRAARDLVVASVQTRRGVREGLARGATASGGVGKTLETYNAHDHWTHIMIEGAGGRVFFDPEPLVQWRRHAGTESGLLLDLPVADRIGIKLEMLKGRDSRANDRIASQLTRNMHLLTQENRSVVERFVKARQAALPFRVWGMVRSGVHRQTPRRNLSLMIEVLLNRL